MRVAETLDSRQWEISLAEQATQGDRGRTDILITHRVSGRRFHIEAKRIEGMKVFWSERQIAVAKAHSAHYFIALLRPSDEKEPYRVHWAWDPMRDLENCERGVQWTWRESPEGGFGSDWVPGGERPEKGADSFRAVIKVTDEFVASLPEGVGSLDRKITPTSF